MPARHLADQCRIALVGLMRREHVVVGGDDAEVRSATLAQRGLVGRGAGGEAVGEIAARQRGPSRPVAASGGVDALQIGRARGAAALDETPGHLGDGGVWLGHENVQKKAD
jgi:hypothetical protein